MPINWFLISILFFPLGSLAIVMFTSKNYLVGFIGIVITTSSIILFYFSILAFMLHKQYSKIEKNRAMTFDKEKRSITILNTKNSNQIILTENNIKGIQINLYTGNQRKPISEYEYIKYFTNENDEIIITSLQTNISNLDSFFKGVKRNSIYRKINWIK
ncbi:hypothetical protein [Flavobacterium lacisediminis]|uniref:PH domain-containing protein n=1 Tax=Flavobacterium lacisediminis TaxID=2989705 RepID=A0ABT3EIY1_9FLAO|nr:hypothetical protein [Flavobacterium lacisediminis]MCW1148526.1 hypothetical protein [Flavobacterium lacisediminis]